MKSKLVNNKQALFEIFWYGQWLSNIVFKSFETS